jgi:ferredoxin-NADP reductase
VSTRIAVLYSVPDPGRVTFGEELERLAREIPGLRVDLTATGAQDPTAAWAGRRGRITTDLLQEAIGRMDRPKIYLCGPPAMVRDLRDGLTKVLGFPGADLRIESFSGY